MMMRGSVLPGLKVRNSDLQQYDSLSTMSLRDISSTKILRLRFTHNESIYIFLFRS
jgi:hypothetical protein